MYNLKRGYWDPQGAPIGQSAIRYFTPHAHTSVSPYTTFLSFIEIGLEHVLAEFKGFISRIQGKTKGHLLQPQPLPSGPECDDVHEQLSLTGDAVNHSSETLKQLFTVFGSGKTRKDNLLRSY